MKRRTCYLLMAPFLFIFLIATVVFCIFNPLFILYIIGFILLLCFILGLGTLFIGSTPWGEELED